MTFDARSDRGPQATRRTWAALAADANSVSQWLGVRRVDEIRTTLAAAGVKLTGPHQGRLRTRGYQADVRLEPDDVIFIGCDATGNDVPQALLERCAAAAGNLRFASAAHGGHRLIADTRIDGIAHLPRTMREICDGFEDLLGGRATAETADDFPVDRFQVALTDAGWPQEDAVKRSDGYELFAAWEGSRIAVQVSAVADAISIRRTILPCLPGGDAGRAVCHQTLACNALLRGCRLAVSDGRLSAAARLNTEQITGDWLAYTVRAVAGVARSVEPVLQLLARDPGVAAAYRAMFLTPEPDSSAETVVHAASVP